MAGQGEEMTESCQPISPGARSDLPAGLAALARQGVLTPGAANDAGLYRMLPPVATGRLASWLLDEERGER